MNKTFVRFNKLNFPHPVFPILLVFWRLFVNTIIIPRTVFHLTHDNSIELEKKQCHQYPTIWVNFIVIF